MEDSSESDLSEEVSRTEQRIMLQTATSRKLLFQAQEGRINRPVQERYQNMVIPISEHSAENHCELTFVADSQDDTSERANA